MAMLAEPRRRKKYNLCPRGKALYEDGSRFGTKMLEKMGWSKGKGLGANEDGSQEFVRVRLKNDAEGLGYEMRDDQWTVHEEGFNGLLKTLNGGGSDDENENKRSGKASESEDERRPMGFGFKAPPIEEVKPKTLKEKISGVSLEEKSKYSKARVHYKKFTRGKDLAQYSEKDLANIFGKKATDCIDVPVIIETTEEEEQPVNPNFAGVQTVSTGLSVSDYFRQKMEAFKSKLKNNEHGPVTEIKAISTSDEKQITEATVNGNEEPLKKRKKKDIDQEQGSEYIEQADETVTERKKKKKSKHTPHEVSVEFQQSTQTIEGTELPKRKKKTKDKESEVSQSAETTTTGNIKHKIKSKSTNITNITESATPDSEETNSPKRKKKKKDKQDENEEVTSTREEIETPKCETKKRKKSKELVAPATENIELNEIAAKPANKSKKNKSDEKEEEIVEPEITEKSTKGSKKKSDDDELIEKADKPTKKSKKNKSDGKEEEIVELEITDKSSKGSTINPEDELIETADEPAKKKSRKNKSDEKEEEIVEPMMTDKTTRQSKTKSNESTTEETFTTAMKKKSKKHNSDVSADSTDNSDSPANQEQDKLLSMEELITKRDSFDIITISSFCAEKFHIFDMSAFKNSSMAQLTGYGVSDNVKLNVVETKNDANRIVSLWNSRNNKYVPANVPKKVRIRKSQKKISMLKKRQVFAGI